jgi:hypothetical protein
MAKKVSNLKRIIAFFMTATDAEVATAQDAIAAVLETRQGVIEEQDPSMKTTRRGGGRRKKADPAAAASTANES